jgi:hypothetical protein
VRSLLSDKPTPPLELPRETLADLIRDLIQNGWMSHIIPAHINYLRRRGLLDVPELPEVWQVWQNMRGWEVMTGNAELIPATRYQCRAADWAALLKAEPTVFPGDAEDEPAPRSVRGQHKPPAKIKAESTKIVARVDAYAEENECSKDAACEALYRELGRASGPALKSAYYLARKRLKPKGK